jgi:hypothetical protein
MAESQNFKNHVRLNPLYHKVALSLLLANLLWAIYQIYRELTGSALTGASVMALLLAVGLLALALSVRVQILTVQDRLIRLEMRLRLQQVLPATMQAQIGSLTIPQLVALRFASDAELPALTAQVLSGQCATSKEIKMKVKDWQGDYQRA